ALGASAGAAANGAAVAEPVTVAQPAGRRAKGPSKNRQSAQQKAERAVEQAEASLAEVEQELTDPAAWASRYEAAKSEARHTAARRAVEAAYAELEALVD
ncbi:MAG: family ATP-binding cassette protein, partial [Solirubrobacterales bacterium]|nr:family ATP-binding cassette protein [Solirubrobacterales bacterium]